MYNSRPILAYERNMIASSIRLGDPPKYRQKLLSDALSVFKGLEIPYSIPTTKFGEYPKDIRLSQYSVYGWRLNKRDVNMIKI